MVEVPHELGVFAQIIDWPQRMRIDGSSDDSLSGLVAVGAQRCILLRGVMRVGEVNAAAHVVNDLSVGHGRNSHGKASVPCVGREAQDRGRCGRRPCRDAPSSHYALHQRIGLTLSRIVGLTQQPPIR